MWGEERLVAEAGHRARYWPTAATLDMPYGVDVLGHWLPCADTANSRLRGYHRARLQGGAAVALTAQPYLGAEGDNGWGQPARGTVCWPYGLELAGAGLAVVADTGNHRVCLWPVAEELVR